MWQPTKKTELKSVDSEHHLVVIPGTFWSRWYYLRDIFYAWLLLTYKSVPFFSFARYQVESPSLLLRDLYLSKMSLQRHLLQDWTPTTKHNYCFVYTHSKSSLNVRIHVAWRIETKEIELIWIRPSKSVVKSGLN